MTRWSRALPRPSCETPGGTSTRCRAPRACRDAHRELPGEDRCNIRDSDGTLFGATDTPGARATVIPTPGVTWPTRSSGRTSVAPRPSRLSAGAGRDAGQGEGQGGPRQAKVTIRVFKAAGGKVTVENRRGLDASLVVAMLREAAGPIEAERSADEEAARGGPVERGCTGWECRG